MGKVFSEKAGAQSKQNIVDIIEYYVNHPDETIMSIGQRFSVSECTVTRYIRDYWMYIRPRKEYMTIVIKSKI